MRRVRRAARPEPWPQALGSVIAALILASACAAPVTPSVGPTAAPTPVRTDRPTPAVTQPVGPTGSEAAPGPTAGSTPTPSVAPGASVEPTPASTPQPTPATTPEPTGPPPSPQAIAVAQKPCPKDRAEGWSCITLTVPLDHFVDIGRTTDVTFAIKRHTAKGPAKGTWVTITGGPGTSGIWSAASYASSFAPAIRQQYDLVFMDQRGGDLSGPFQCTNAALAFYTNPAAATDPDGGAALKAGAKRFVDDCLAESKVDQTALPYYATRQAVEDLEAFRLWLGVDKMSIYGESYGTQYVQTYAAMHPDNVKALFIDGPVDLQASGQDYYIEGARAFDDVLVATLLDCTTQRACSSDVQGGNELTAYDELAARLAKAPIEYKFTTADGSQEERLFTLTDLQNAAIDSMYNESDRELFQRAMAVGSRVISHSPTEHHEQRQIWWLARLTYAGLVQDPDTLKPITDPSYSDALYYAVECTDYAYFTDAGTPDQRADAYVKYGQDRGVDAGRMAADYYGDLPCVYWPAQPGPDPRPVIAHDDARFPWVVLGSTLDPATPFVNAERIVARYEDRAWLIYKPGGPHIIYGRGEACPDDLVTDILVRGRFPKERKTVCPGDVADDYVHVLPSPLGQLLSTMSSYEDEIVNGVDYQYWDGEKPLTYGCPFGGTITYTPFADGSRLRLKDCAFFIVVTATGTGVIDDSAGTFRLDVRFGGGGTGSASYFRGAGGHRTVRGSLRIGLGG